MSTSCSGCGAGGPVVRLLRGGRCEACKRAKKAAYKARWLVERPGYMARYYASRPELGRGGGHVRGADHPRFVHGHAGMPEHLAWRSALDRCSNPRSQSWPNYGGRGITMCPEWIASFETFLDHIGKRPSATYELDRIDNDGSYEPGNVRWASKHVQSVNRRTTKLSDAEVIEIRALHTERRYSNVEIAAMYAITAAYVCDLTHGRRRILS